MLANIYLNKLDWWVSNQYLTCDNSEEKEKAIPGILIRYADDGIIFCRKMEDAQIWLNRLQKFSQKTLKINLKDKKTKIVDLRKETLDFLGYQLEANRRGLAIYDKAHYKAKHEGKSPTYIVKLSEISLTNKAIERIIQNIHWFAKIILALLQGNRNYSPALAKAIMDYNVYVRGVHNYYEVCTEASPNFWKIYQRCLAKFRKLYKLRDPESARFKDKDKYSDYNNRIFSITGIPIVPIWAIKQKKIWVPPWRYTHYNVKPKIEMLVAKELSILSRNYIPYRSVEYNDNRLSRYSMQRGLDAVTQFFIPAHSVHCHHVQSRKDHGTDKFKNLVIVAVDTHKLIHTPKAEIPAYFTAKQIIRLNKYRLRIYNEPVNSTFA